MVRAYSEADYSGAGNANWEDEHVRIGLAAVLALIEREPVKVTDEMIEAYRTAGHHIAIVDREALKARLAAVLALIDSDVQPFAFAGFPDNPVYIHPCGEVVDVSRVDGEMRAAVDVGDCDCEGGQPWQRIYVKNEAKA
jgi:hypothetical protein